MPRKLHNALTDAEVRNAGPGRHADGGGLYLRVQNGGARSWLFRMLVDGKARDIGLGPAAGAGAVSLADARKAARALAVKRDTGEAIEGKRTRARRLAADRRASAAAVTTFREVAEGYIALNERDWKNAKHRQQWRNTLEAYVYPIIGDLPVASIATCDVLEVLKPVWHVNPETASRVRGRIETVLSAAKVQGLRSGENPALWRGHLDKVLPAPSKTKARVNRERKRGDHHPALAYAELPAFMAELRKLEGISARALEFAILTNTRVSETTKATWGEVDLAKGLWSIPDDRMKAGKAHEIPLSGRAVAILRDMLHLRLSAKLDAPLFPNPKGKALSQMAMPVVVRRMHEAETKQGREGWIDRNQHNRPVTVHGFRSTFRDWAGEQTSFPREVIEHALAHRLKDKAEAAYSRATLLPKRAKLMEAWADYAAAPVAAGAVTPIRKQVSEGTAQ